MTWAARRGRRSTPSWPPPGGRPAPCRPTARRSRQPGLPCASELPAVSASSCRRSDPPRESPRRATSRRKTCSSSGSRSRAKQGSSCRASYCGRRGRSKTVVLHVAELGKPTARRSRRWPWLARRVTPSSVDVRGAETDPRAFDPAATDPARPPAVAVRAADPAGGTTILAMRVTWSGDRLPGRTGDLRRSSFWPARGRRSLPRRGPDDRPGESSACDRPRTRSSSDHNHRPRDI